MNHSNDASGSNDGPSRDRGGDTRTALLEAARSLFARGGFDGTSVRAITGAAGTNLGAVTYHFGSKRALYEAVLAGELEPIRDAVLTIAGGDEPAVDRMAAIVEAYFHLLGEHPDLPRLLMQELAAGRRPPEAVVRVFRVISGALVDLQAQGTADGSIRPGDPLLTALSVLAQPIYMNLVGPMVRELLGVPFGRADHRTTMIRHATAFVRQGLAPTSEAST